MFRIRRVFDAVLPVDRAAIAQVRGILAGQFSTLPDRELDSLEAKLHNPFAYRFRSVLFVAEQRRRLLGFALLLYEPDLDFAYLDYIAAAPGLTGGGVGGSLYERLRDETTRLGCRALLFECLPDDPEQESDADRLRENQARLAFYEAYGARPTVANDYQSPVDASGDALPYLVVDPLGRPEPMPRAWIRKAVRAILERKYPELCPPEYVDRVVESFSSPQVKLREFRYAAERAAVAPPSGASVTQPVPMVVNDRHEIHHVRERGYVEAPVRIQRILRELEPTGWFRQVAPAPMATRRLERIHSPELVGYLERASHDVAEGESLYPYVFPIRNRARQPRERSVLAGYYCIDTFTPISRNSFKAAKRAAECALTAADQVIGGERVAYALVRPPGHHAERESFGGFCYFNNSALAADALAEHGRVAILDIDYHHGNGQQDIFYRRADVLTVSIHGHPRFAYPYFTGFEDERGEDEGEGLNLNLPMPQKADGKAYRKTLRQAIDAVAVFAPHFLVVALGLDPAKGDPTGTWSLTAADFERNGELIAGLGLPTVVVQEGGYRTRTLGTNARRFFKGLLGAR